MVHVGFGNIVALNKVVAIVSPGSAPVRRMLQASRSKGQLIDLTSGRRTKAALVMDSGQIILVALAPETIAGRLAIRRETHSEAE